MHLPVATIVCFLALILGVTADFKYWLDESCLHYPMPMGQELSVRPYLEEMFRMARLALSRMSTDKNSQAQRDQQFRRMHRLIFKTEMDPDDTKMYDWGLEYKEFWGIQDSSPEAKDTAFNIVTDTLEKIANGWSETPERTEGDNRVYCDNGQHFDVIENDRYVDKLNNVWAGGSCDPEGATVYAFVTCEKYNEDIDDEPPCLLTICDRAFESFRYPGLEDPSTAIDKPFLLTDLIKNDQITSGLSFDEHAGFSSLLMHEWSHTQPHLTEDWYIGDDDETGATAEWKCILDIPNTGKAVINAEAISYIGLSALLIEGEPNSHKFWSIGWGYEGLENKQLPTLGVLVGSSKSTTPYSDKEIKESVLKPPPKKVTPPSRG